MKPFKHFVWILIPFTFLFSLTLAQAADLRMVYFASGGVTHRFMTACIGQPIDTFNACTETATPIQAAVDFAVLNPPDNGSIYVEAGTYNEAVIIDSFSGLTLHGTGDNPISAINGSVTLRNSSHIAFTGFAVTHDIFVTNVADVSIVGSPGDDPLNLILSGVNNLALDGGAGNDALNLAGGNVTGHLRVLGSAGDDVLTVDNSDASIMPLPSGIVYDGGDDFDSLTILGGSYNYETYTGGPGPGDGVFTFDGAPITFTNIEPVCNTTAGNLTVTGTVSGDTITIRNYNAATDGAACPGFTTTTITGLGELIKFANKPNVIINAGNGNDNITLNTTAEATGLNTLTINGGNNDDTITLTSNATGVSYAVNGNANNDLITVSNNANFTLNNNSLTISTFPIPTFTLGSDIEQANLTGGASNNTFTVSGWTGTGTLDGAGGTGDMVVSSNNANFTLTNTLLDVSGGATLTLANMEIANLTGGTSSNNFTVSGWTGTGTLVGGSGSGDTVISSNDTDFTLTNASLIASGVATFTLTTIEQATLTGGGSNNIINAAAFTAGPVTLNGAGGTDTVTGGSSSDTITGGPGDDTLSGGAGNDTYPFDADSALGSDTVSDSAGTDELDFSATTSQGVTINLSSTAVQTVNPNLTLTLAAGNSIENLSGTSQNDTITGNALSNSLIGDTGDDTYIFDTDSAQGSDTIDETGGGTDTLDFSPTIGQNITINLNTFSAQTINSNLTLTLPSVLFIIPTIENVIGGSLNDSLTGNGLNNTLIGGPGNDILNGGGSTTLLGNDDTYIFADGWGIDTVTDNLGNPDTLDFTAVTTSISLTPGLPNGTVSDGVNSVAFTGIEVIRPSGDLGISKTDGQTSVVPGSTLTYTIVVTNAGPNVATNAQVSDTLPAALTGVTWTCSAAAGSSCPASGSGDISATVTLAVSGRVTFTVSGVVAPAATGLLTNTARVTVPGGMLDLITGNNVATDTDTLTPQADLALTKTVTPAGSMAPGQALSYTLTFTNNGLSTAAGVVITDIIPDILTNVSFTSSGAIITSTAGLTYSWQVEDLAPNAGGVIIISGIISPGLTSDTIFTNTATITTTTPDTNAADNSDSVPVTVTVPRVAFSDLAYSVVENAGPALISLTMTPAPLAEATVVLTSSDGTADSLSDYVPVNQVLTFAPGQSILTASLIITDDLVDELDETVNLALSSPSGAALELPSTAVLTILDNDLAGFSVSKTADPTDIPELGGVITFSLSITSTGVEAINLDSLTDSIHGDLNGQGNCATGGPIIGGGIYNCAFTATVTGNAGFIETDVITATVSDDEGNSASASDDATVTITDVPSSISVTKTANPTNLPEPSGLVTFTVRVDNTSLVDSVTITSLDDDIHGDLNGQGDCTVPQDIAAGSFYECAFTATIFGNAGDSETDTVTASGTDDDSVNVSASDKATVTIDDALPTITVSKTADPTNLDEPGGPVTFTIVIRNTSVETVTLTSLDDDIHGNLAGQGSCALFQTIAVGDTYTCAFTATFTGNASDSETDTVTATAQDDENNTVSASDDATVTIADVLPSITVNKTADPTNLDEPGGPVTFTVVVSNTGVETVTLTSLKDDIHGDLDGQGSCALSQTVAVGDAYTCAFTATITGNAGDTETDTVTATAEDDESNTIEANGSATVTIGNVPATILVTKTAGPTSVIEPGGLVTFTVRVDNTSLVDSVTITSLNDDIHGDLNGQGDCVTPQPLAAGAFYQCAFTATVSGSAGEVETDIVIAFGVDDDGEEINGSAEATVSITPALPGIEVTKTASMETATVGQTITYTYQVTNTGNVNLTDVSASDDKLGAVTFGTVTLAPGQSATGLLTYMVAAGDLPGPLTNIVTVSGTPPFGSLVTATAVVSVNLLAPEPSTTFIYLPLIMNNNQASASASDLVVESLSVSGGEVQVIIKNQGGTAVVDGFWVDVYFDPHPVPTGVNQIWDDGRSTYGLVWGVTTPIAPNGTLTLTISDAYFWPSLSNWPATLPSGTPIYAQVDSVNLNTTYGGVREGHEISGGTYNNIIGPVVVSDSLAQVGMSAVDQEEQSASTSKLPIR